MRRADRAIEDRSLMKDLLKRADCCHLAMVDNGAPYLVTMNYGFLWEGETPILYFHSAKAGRKIDVLTQNPQVCWSIDLDHELVLGDEASHCTMRYRCLVGTGVVRMVSDPTEKKKGLDLIMRQYSSKTEFHYPPQVVDQTAILRLEVAELTGKQRQ